MTTYPETQPAASLEHEASFQLLFHQLPLPMWVVDGESLAFLAVNDAAVRKYGYSRDAFMGMAMDDFATPDDAAGGGEPAWGETQAWRHRCKDGTVLEVESTWHEMQFAGCDAVLVLTMDRTAQRRAEERVREQASMLNLAADAIMVREIGGRVLFWNKGAERLYGWTAEEAVGKSVLDLFVRVRRPDAEQELIEKGAWSGEIKHVSKAGAEIVVNSRWTLVLDAEGRAKSVFVINSDMTEAKKMEAQFLRAQRLESIGTLASGIAHDLNNILSPILMASGILRSEMTDPDSTKMLNIIEGSAERGAGIVKQVLTFARGVEGERVLLQPKHLLGELGKIMSQTFPRNVDIQTHFPPDLWTITGDATQIHQVLLNLCVNARDAMEGGGTLTLAGENVEVDGHFASTNPGAQLGAHVVFRVSDTGMGMTPETMERIFDPFFTTKEVGKGTGLGLATVIGIVKSHGGFLNLQSEVGVGTTFRVFLPATRDGQVEAGRAEQAAVTGGHDELVLVVDDEAAIREALVGTLKANGYRAYTAEDGTDALALYFQRRKEIAVVLTDLSMGGMDGIELTRSLRKLNPDVRVIASSGHFQKENMTILGGLGVKHFLDKPYSAEKLLRTLSDALRAG